MEQWGTFPVVVHSKLLQEGINDSSTRSPNNPELQYYHIAQFSGENFNNQVTAEERALCDGGKEKLSFNWKQQGTFFEFTKTFKN